MLPSSGRTACVQDYRKPGDAQVDVPKEHLPLGGSVAQSEVGR